MPIQYLLVGNISESVHPQCEAHFHEHKCGYDFDDFWYTNRQSLFIGNSLL